MNDKVSLMNAAGSHRHASLEQYERSAADLYVTPAQAVQRLYRARPFLTGAITWDSSAGLGHIVRAIRDCGGPCSGTELYDHPFPKVAEIETGVDFLKLERPRAVHLVINPPYKQARQHIEHGLKLGCKVYALLRIPFLASKKTALMFPHLRELIIVGRQGMLPPGVEDKGVSPQVDYGWFVFGPGRKDGNGIVLERA